MEIKTVLKNLGINSNQKACSAGDLWIASGPKISSYICGLSGVDTGDGTTTSLI